MQSFSLFAIAAAAAVTLIAAPVAGCDDLVRGPKGTVTEVTDGDTVILDTGMTVRLIGTQAPKLPLGREGYPTWPLADEAKAELEALVLGKPVQLRYGGARVDRYGRALGQLFVADTGVWAQGEMVGRGLARVYSFPDNRKCLAELFAAEAKARAMGLGIWSDPYYSVRRADRPADLLDHVGQYELVEGRVFVAEDVGGRIYLNFGRLFREDFTVVIERSSLDLFTRSGIDPLMLEGALVRVRGWVDDRDGPRIEVTHPEQIEVLATR